MRRDRHGRSLRADSDPRRRPPDGFRVRDATRFRQIVLDAISALPERLGAPLDAADIAVTDVPLIDEAVTTASAWTRLDGFELATFDRRAKPRPLLTVYRRPLETRAESRTDLEDVVKLAIGEAVARALGMEDDLDDLFGDEGF